MKRFLIAVLFAPLFLTACQPSMNPDLEDESLYGTWVRQATYVNGELEHKAPATLVIDANHFSSQTQLCTTSGIAVSHEDQLEVQMTESDCPSPLQLPFSLTYDYEITDSGTTLLLTNGEVTEEYQLQ